MTKQITASLPELTKDLSPQQNAWLSMATIKANLFANLQASELAIQGFLKGATEIEALEIVQGKIKDAKDEYERSKGERMHFTGTITDKLIAPAMEFEKRNFELITAAGKHELELRVKENEDNEKAEAYNKEKVLMATHFTNEYFRIAADYRVQLAQYITMQYTGALKQKIKVKEIPDLIASIVRDIAAYKPGKVTKFERKLLSVEDAKQIFSSVPPYNHSSDLKEAQNQVSAKFLLYAQDLKNAEDAIRSAEQEQEKLQTETAEQVVAEQSVNNLVAQSEALVLTGGPKVKRLYEVVIEDDSQGWAVIIMSTFIKNIMVLQKNVRVKGWSKLTIGQMAAAIGKHVTDTGVQFPNIKTIIVKK